MAKTHISCIKIAGYPILPPLITEERRIELKKDRCKAIEIEKRIKEKRNSIDSGVMTGSYIETLKHLDVIPNELSLTSLADVYALSSELCKAASSDLDSTSTDSFLKSALEDTEFREFFYSTAERIFNDNNALNCNTNVPNADVPYYEADYVIDLEKHNFSNTKSCISDMSSFSNCVDTSTLNNSEAFANTTGETCKPLSNAENINNNQPEEKSSSPPPLVRRNSYTLDTPSPVLLQHMAKENAENGAWRKLPDEKNPEPGLDFKTFSGVRKCRKTWSKEIPDNIFTSNDIDTHVSDEPNNRSTVSEPNMKRSTTFVKSNETSHSLPSSPTARSNFSGSTDCIQSTLECSANLAENSPSDLVNNNTFSTDTNADKSAKDCRSETLNNNCSVDNEMPNCVHKDASKALLTNLPDKSNSNCDTETIYIRPPDMSYFNQALNDQLSQLVDTDESISDCSSFSLSKFLPVNNRSERPVSTECEDLTSLLSDLSLRHKRQIIELLHRQQKEKLILSNMHSESSITSGRSSVNLSIGELPHDRSILTQDVGAITQGISPCIRELFPNQILPHEDINFKNSQKISDEERDAAVKITAWTRGYLTRRLLKTERLKQLIEVIKESLNCAISLQSEARLKKTDFELHERLAQQLTAALYELQSIISSSAANRMAIIAADREKLKKPPSRPSSAISSATRKSILRRQQSHSALIILTSRNATQTKCLLL